MDSFFVIRIVANDGTTAQFPIGSYLKTKLKGDAYHWVSHTDVHSAHFYRTRERAEKSAGNFLGRPFSRGLKLKVVEFGERP